MSKKPPERIRSRAEARIVVAELLVLICLVVTITVLSALARNQAVAGAGFAGTTFIEVVAIVWLLRRLPI